jgi:hypothetical protein
MPGKALKSKVSHPSGGPSPFRYFQAEGGSLARRGVAMPQIQRDLMPEKALKSRCQIPQVPLLFNKKYGSGDAVVRRPLLFNKNIKVGMPQSGRGFNEI